MPDLHSLIQNGGANAWLCIPVAILLGALHGLEPGHSKTMMAAFIIAIRGTIGQAVLLGLSAAISHSLIIWLLAALALQYGSQWNAEETEPYFQLASAALILALALWMFIRTTREVKEAAAHSHFHSHLHDHSHGHEHDHSHSHATATVAEIEPNPWQDAAHSHGNISPATQGVAPGEFMSPGGLILPSSHATPVGSGGSVILTDAAESKSQGLLRPERPERRARLLGPHGGMLLDTGHGWLEISIFETNVAPRFRIYPCKSNGQPVSLPKSTQLSIQTARVDGTTQKFSFATQDTCWESTSELPEPHEFLAVITLGHADHAHTYKLRFSEAEHGHSHGPAVSVEPEEDGVEYQDAHERAHAQDIAKRFANRSVTTPQIILFGITGGLMPCPAAFTILVVCLQVKRATLGFAIVGAFSFGLALTMITVGAIAAWSVNRAQKRFSGFGEWMRRAPYISCAMLVLLASYMAYSGWQGLQHGHVHA
jgi:nickel/cobalt transporter (NicO) family protein